MITGLITNTKTISGQERAFFHYYSKPFSSTFAIANSESFVTNKYTRIDYQRKLQIRRRNDLVISKSKGYITFFSSIFKKNNLKKYVTGIIKARNPRNPRNPRHVRTPMNKLKLRSIKDVAPKVIHPTEISLGRTIFIGKKLNRVSVKAIFPWQINYRFTKRAKKTFNVKRKRQNKSVVNRVRSKLYQKSLGSWGLQFKLFPTNYKETSLNANKFAQFKALVSVTMTSQFSFYQVNALSLTRFAFDFQIKNAQKTIRKKMKFSQKFLESYERGLVSRFRGTGIFFKDLVRISFFSMYLKKADFLANFFAFTLSKLPRDRKELKFVRFLIKILKTAASQNKSILGVRIRFQGRVNR